MQETEQANFQEDQVSQQKISIKYADVKEEKQMRSGASHRHTRRCRGHSLGDTGKAQGSICGLSRLLFFKVGQWVFTSVRKPALQDSLATGATANGHKATLH